MIYGVTFVLWVCGGVVCDGVVWSVSGVNVLQMSEVYRVTT